MKFFHCKKVCVPRQYLITMKFIVLLMTVTLLQVSAKTAGQTVSISGKDMSLKKVFTEIEKQAGYVFFYDADLMKNAKPVTVQLKNVAVESALDKIFLNQPLTWTLENRTVTVMRKSLPLLPVSRLADPPHPSSIRVTGIVTDERGSFLEGVSVVVQGTNLGTSTNAKGYYSLEVEQDAILVFSSVGYLPETVEVKGQTRINVRLAIDLATQQEIVVASTGYQAISKDRSTGSYEIVGTEQLDKPATNIGSRLIGQVAGMQASVDVNGNPTFEIRGQTSLYANAQPLIVVDGFAIQGDLNSINPNDVESVTILKDAAAASIWGARSANGVIVVTTRKAKKGTPLKIDFNVFTRIGQKFDLDYVNPLASPQETVEYEKLLFSKNWSPLNNNGSLSNYYFAYSQASTAINEYKLGFMTEAEMNATLDKLSAQSNKDQISKYLLANPGNTQYNLNLYGGSERMSTAVSLMYESNQTNFKESYNKRYMINYRGSAAVFKWLDFNLSAMLQYNDIHNSGVTLSDIQGLSPYDMLLDEEGHYANINRYYWPMMERLVPMEAFPYSNWGYNPLQEIRNRDIATKRLNARIQAGLTLHILKGLSIDSRVQYERIISDNQSLYNDSTFYVRQRVNEATSWDLNTNELTPNLPKGGILNQNKSEIEAFNFRNQVNFNQRFLERHEVAFVAGSEINDIVTKGNNYPTSYGYNDATLTLGNFPNGPGGTFHTIKNWQGSNQTFSYTNSFSYATDRYFSLYGNLAYTFDRKYTLSGSYRTDASNLITDDPKYRYAPFWSVGAAWHASREVFLQPASWLDDLRIRLTYGYNGNVDKSTAFRPLISLGSVPNVYINDYTATISSYGNPALRWEKTGTWNIGIDFSLLRAKLFGKVDVYNKHGKDLIATLSIPAVNGTTSQKLNNAEMTNRGIELTLGTLLSIKKNDIVWRGSLNFSYNKNKITNLFVANYAAYNLYGGGTAAYVVGKDANTLWAFEYAGVREADNQPIVKGTGKDVYDFTGWTPGDGRDYLLDMGTKVAPYGLGVTSQFKIYDFDFSFIITGKFGHVFNRQSFNYPPLWTARVLPNSSLSEVMYGDQDKVVPLPLNDNEGRFYFWDRFYPYMNYLVESASHLRMQEVNLTYHLPLSLMDRLRLKGDFRLYVQGNNLFTILANKYGEDPEYPKGMMKPQPQYTLGARFTF